MLNFQLSIYYYYPEDEMKDLIEILKEVMKSKGLSPEQAAFYLGCSGQQIRRWVKGKSKPASPIYRKAIKEGIERIKQEVI